MAARRVLLLAVLALVSLAGCGRRHCVPAPLATSRDLIDLSQPPDAHAPVGAGLLREVAAEFRRRGEGRHPPGARPYHALALSGGGLYGTFGVGVLSGWSEAGTRPEFDVVTGISTGALMATFAFLGPAYDANLEQFIGIERREILRLRRLAAIPFGASLFTTRPLARQIEATLTDEVLGAVAEAHAAGRRLYVGTTNLDTRGLIIWDMGAIAARGTAEARRLYRDVVRASSAIPGAAPPVRLPVEIDGVRYEELHVDGGVSDEVIFRAFMVADLNRAAGLPGAYAPPGSTLYVLSNGKLYADPSCVRARILPILSASSSSILYGKTRDELYRIYLNCLQTGMDFRLTAVPRAMRLSSGTGSLELTPEDQERLFDAGRAIGRTAPAGEGWRDDPPGTDPAEQALPRAGTRFASPR